MIGMQATTLSQFAASWLLKANCWELSIGFAVHIDPQKSE